MGLFDRFKKRAPEASPQADVPQASKPENTAGWKAIEHAFETLYPGQTDPKHYGTLIGWIVGGNDPLDGVSIYDAGDAWHYVTYGLSELYDKESEHADVSGYGMEFTLKLRKGFGDDEEAELKGLVGILQSLARVTFTKGEVFRPYEYVYTGQTTGMDRAHRSAITGFFTVPEPDVAPIDTPNGRVEFVRFVGATDTELKAVVNKELTVQELFERIGSDVTDYGRASVI